MAFGADISETLGNVGNRTTAHGYNKPDEIRRQYTGYEHDDESGLDFAQARYYNSSHGRFTSVDPLTASANVKAPQTFNRYTYALNSPYKFTDPLGLIAQCCNRADIENQIKKDITLFIDGDDGVEIPVKPDEEGWKKIFEVLVPIYEQASRLGANAQKQINDAGGKPPEIVEQVIEENSGSTSTERSVTGGINGTVGGETKQEAEAKNKVGTDGGAIEDAVKGDVKENASGSGSVSTTITTKETSPTKKTTSKVKPDNSAREADDNLKIAQNKVPELAKNAADSLNKITITGTVLTSNNTLGTGIYGFNLNSFDLEPPLQRMFDKGRELKKPK